MFSVWRPSKSQPSRSNSEFRHLSNCDNSDFLLSLDQEIEELRAKKITLNSSVDDDDDFSIAATFKEIVDAGLTEVEMPVA